MSDKQTAQVEIIPIRVEIKPGGLKFPLNIILTKEPIVRDAAKLIRDKFNLYRERFVIDKVSDEDIMAMVALDIATAKLTFEKQNEISPLLEKVSGMNDKLKEYLNIQK
ncbi:MAG: cell division protein ZapA [Tannerella sp.]|jgi:hypothetical protein|nr:cell division protein ZapA [Tannerella sp.]